MSVTAVGPETQVNTNTAGDQTAPQVIALSDGRYDIVWKTATGWSLQLYAADGTAVGGEVAFTSEMPTAFVGLPDGRIGHARYRMSPLVWDSLLFYGVLNADGTTYKSPSGGSFTVLSPTPQIHLDLAVTTEGQVFAVANNYSGIAIVQIGANVGFGGLGQLVSPSSSQIAQVNITAHDDVLVTWASASGGVSGGYAIPYDLQDRFALPVQSDAYVATADGSITTVKVVEDNGETKVAVQVLGDGGAQSQFYLENVGANPTGLALFELADHRTLVTWLTDSGANSASKTIMGAVFDGAVPTGDAFIIATDAAESPAIAVADVGGGHFVVSWQSSSIDGAGTGIASQMFDAGSFEPLIFDGSDTADVWRGGVLGDLIAGNGGNDTLAGGLGADSIDGGAGGDSLFGGDGNDSVDGGTGDDVLSGGAGNDAIYGGDGQDTVIFTHNRTNYRVTLDGGTFTIVDRTEVNGDGIDRVSGVESFVFNGVTIVASKMIDSAPTALDDGGTLTEANTSLATTSYAGGNALSNDTDPDSGDVLSVTGVRAGSESQPGDFEAVAASAPTPLVIVGTYGQLQIQADGHWSYMLDDIDPDTQALTDGTVGHDIFTYRMTDAELTDLGQIDVSVVGRNDPPSIQSIDDITLDENTRDVTTVIATHVDGEVTYAIGSGLDGVRFTIDPQSGALRFTAAPDFERPMDSNRDNIYRVIVSAINGSAQDERLIQVTVRDVADAPTPIDAPVIPSHSPVNAVDWVDYIAPPTINVFFAEAGVRVTDYHQNQSGGTFTAEGWTSGEKAAVASIFATYEAATEVRFQIVTSIAEADFVMAKNPGTPGTAIVGNDGYWDVGVNPISYGSSIYTVDGIGVFNTDSNANGTVGDSGDFWNAASLQPGGYAYAILAHEIGHGLGLAHPHDNGGGSEIMDGVTAPNVTGDYDLNQGIYTTMTYNDGWPFEPGVNTQWQPGASTFAYGWQAGPMALDIAALQRKYGSNPDHNGDDTVYVLPDSNASGTAFTAIWDTGGTDTIRYNGARDVTISLIAATLDYSWTGGGDPSYANGVRGGFTIAAGVVIENAIGGSGDDWLVGNSAHNILDGGAGSDLADYQSESGALSITLNGASDATVYVDSVAEDILRSIEELAGGTAGDIFTGDAANNWFIGGGGKDTLDGGAGSDWASYREKTGAVVVALDGANWVDVSVGGVVEDRIRNIENIKGGWGNDRLTGDAQANVLWGMDGNDTLKGGAGNDSLDGGSGVDTADFTDAVTKIVVTLNNGAGTATIGTQQVTLAGIEDLWGGSAGDALTGDGGANTLFGNGGNDTLNGGAGNDTLKGGAGNDSLVGGTGIDIADFSDKTAKVTLTLKSGAGSATIGTEKDALTGIEWLAGGSAGDALTGDTGANKIWGNGGADTLVGGSGNDTLYGGAGSDRLDGGAGADRFVFDVALSAAGNVDSIVKFEHGSDRIMLDATLFAGVGASLVASELYIASGAVAAHDADDRIVYDKKTGWLYYDDDGLGGDAAVHFATLLNKPTTLTYVDFQIA